MCTNYIGIKRLWHGGWAIIIHETYMGEVQGPISPKKKAVKRAELIAVAMAPNYKYVGVIDGGATPAVRVMTQDN